MANMSIYIKKYHEYPSEIAKSKKYKYTVCYKIAIYKQILEQAILKSPLITLKKLMRIIFT